MEKSIIAKRVRAFRKLKGYTQAQLAELLGISLAVLGSIERGTRKPDAKILEQISAVLGIHLEELQATNSPTEGRG